MKVTEEIRDLVKYCCEVCDCPELFSKISIEFNSRFISRLGDASGNFYDGYKIRLASKLWPLVKNDKQWDTVIHEACHIIEAYKYKNWSHGPKWKMLMKKCGGNPSRCYTAKDVEIFEGAISKVKRKKKTVKIQCLCEDGCDISLLQFKRAKAGKYSGLRCNTCKKDILEEVKLTKQKAGV